MGTLARAWHWYVIEPTSRGHEFEEYAGDIVRRRFPENDGWQIRDSTGTELASGRRVDYRLYNNQTRETGVAEVKSVKELTLEEMNQIYDYKRQLRAKHAIMVISYYTEVQDSAREFAVEHGIEIHRTRGR